MIERPQDSEFPSYFLRYIGLYPPDVDILDRLEKQKTVSLDLFSRIGEKEGLYRYGPAKWSVKEVLGHVTDTERIFSYRALAVARQERKTLPGFEQDEYVAAAHFDDVPLEVLAGEYRTVRDHTLALLRGFTADVLLNTGNISDYRMTVRAIPFIIGGHELHHHKILVAQYHVGGSL
jgi:hypothetical protein